MRPILSAGPTQAVQAAKPDYLTVPYRTNGPSREKGTRPNDCHPRSCKQILERSPGI